MMNPWTDPRSYEDESECAEDMLRNPLPGILDAIGDFISDGRFMAGVFVGTWFTVGAAFVVAFA